MNIQDITRDEKKKKILGIIVIVIIVLLALIAISKTSGPSQKDIDKKNQAQAETQILSDFEQLAPRDSITQSERVRLEMPIVTITADTTTVAPEQPAVITWGSKNTTNCADGIGNQIRLEGSFSITPKEDFTLDIVCTGPKGSAAGSLTISVVSAPLINLSVYPEKVAPGEQAFIAWSTSNTKSCVGGAGKTLRLNDTLSISPRTPYTFNISCVGEKGEAKKTITVGIDRYATRGGGGGLLSTLVKKGASGTMGTDFASTIPKTMASARKTSPGERTVTSVGQGPKITLTFNPDTLMSDTDFSTFSWSVVSSTSTAKCTRSAPTGIVVKSATNSSAFRNLKGSAVDEAGLFNEMAGSLQVWLPKGFPSTKITFNCANEEGRTTASNTLSLDNALASITEGPTIELFADPETVSLGGSSEVSWETTNTIPGGKCFARATAEATVFDPERDAYQTSMYNSKVSVPPNGKMKVTPGLSNSPIPGGGTSGTSRWVAANFGGHTLFGGGGGDSTSYYTPATVTVSCTNRIGTTEKSITVQVPPPPPSEDCGVANYKCW